MRRGWRRVEATIDGTTIHYEEQGQGSHRVVLLHGWGCDTKLMKPIADALSGEMRVLSLDFPGHGQSGRPPEPWGVPEFASATRKLLEQLDFLPCSVIAHSFGGRVTIQLASEAPALFEKLVLTGAAGIRPPQTEEGRRRSEQYRRLRKLCDGLKKARIFGKLPERLEEQLRRKYGSRDYNALDAEMRKTFVKVISLDLTDRLSQIQQPTLLLWGDRDTETPLWMGQKMEKLIPDAGLVVLEGGTHFAYLEQAPRFTAIVRHFLMEE